MLEGAGNKSACWYFQVHSQPIVESGRRFGSIRMLVLITGGAGFIGRQTRDFIYVKDVVAAKAFFALKSQATGIFNVACGRQVTITDLAVTIRNLTKSSSTIEYCPERPGDVKHSVAGMHQTQTAGFRP